jgi:hypothetical protein
MSEHDRPARRVDDVTRRVDDVTVHASRAVRRVDQLG